MATDNKHSNARFSWSGSIPHSLPTTNLADFTNTLTKSTTKVTDKLFPEWNDQADSAFQGVKKLVPSVDCLTTIDHEHPGDNKIFLHTDASDFCTSAMLTFGPEPSLARPAAFDSKPFERASTQLQCVR